MRADAAVDLDRLRVDGGASANDVLCGVQADILQTPVVRPAVEETTALGAAYAAGLATGVWAGLDDLRALRRVDETFDPSLSASAADRRRERWAEAVERSRGWARDGDSAAGPATGDGGGGGR
jgi:glycerol kinase